MAQAPKKPEDSQKSKKLSSPLASVRIQTAEGIKRKKKKDKSRS